MEPTIIYEDQDLLVIDKPSGMVVNRAESVKGETVEEWAEKYLKVPKVSEVSKVSKAFGTFGTFPTFDIFRERSGVVHRLDKETSGVLIIAKTLEAFIELQRQFKARKVKKTYMALVHGMVEPREGVIMTPLGRLPWNRERFGVLVGGREAETMYRVSSIMYRVSEKEKETFTLLELYPKTGRTHQIRVHLKSINHPVVSDTLYAGRKTARRDRQWCPRLFLHAKKIVFKHPRTGKGVSAEAKLPQELEEVFTKLNSSIRHRGP